MTATMTAAEPDPEDLPTRRKRRLRAAFAERIVADDETLTLEGTPGKVLRAALRRARAEDVAVSFTDEHYSNGRPWRRRFRAEQAPAGSTVHDVQRALRQADVAMVFERGGTLHAVNAQMDMPFAGGPGLMLNESDGLQVWDSTGSRSVWADAATGDLAVHGNATVDGFVTIGGDVDIGGQVNIHGDVTVEGIIEANGLVDNSVDTDQLVNGAVEEAKIGNDSVSRRTVAPHAIGTVEIDANVDILGTITTGSGLTLGGQSSSDITFDNGAYIGGNGTNLVYVTDVTHQFTGNITASGTINEGSTRASKTAIKPISADQAKRLLDVDPVTFKYRDATVRKRTEHWGTDPNTGKRFLAVKGRTDSRRRAGLVAEDLGATGLEGVVTLDDDGQPEARVIGGLEPYLLRLVQDLYEQNTDLRDRVARLERDAA